MRASRLVGLLGLLQARGRMMARQLASELEVSERTILRDIEALSDAGIPVYAVRGSLGGFELLDGFRTDLPAAVPGRPRQPDLGGVAGAGRARILLSPRGRRLAALLGRPAGLRIRRSPRAAPAPAGPVGEEDRAALPGVTGPDGVTGAGELAERGGWMREERASRGGVAGPDGVAGAGELAGRCESSGEERAGSVPTGRGGPGAGREGWVEAWVGIESLEAAVLDLLALGAEVEVLHPPELRARLTATARRIAELNASPATAPLPPA